MTSLNKKSPVAILGALGVLAVQSGPMRAISVSPLAGQYRRQARETESTRRRTRRLAVAVGRARTACVRRRAVLSEKAWPRVAIARGFPARRADKPRKIRREHLPE